MNGLLFMAPALAFALVLLSRRFPGETRLIALGARRYLRPRRAPVRVAVAARPPSALVARGSALLARALATRPPPLLAAQS